MKIIMVHEFTSCNNYSLKTQITLLKKFLFKFFSVLQEIAIQSIPT